MNETPAPASGTVVCHQCGQTHEATYSHEGRYGEGPIYAVVCPADGEWLTDYYTTEVVEFEHYTIKVGDTVEHIDPTRRGSKWLVVKVEGNRLTVTNPSTHGGRTYVAADQHRVSPK